MLGPKVSDEIHGIAVGPLTLWALVSLVVDCAFVVPQGGLIVPPLFAVLSGRTVGARQRAQGVRALLLVIANSRVREVYSTYSAQFYNKFIIN